MLECSVALITCVCACCVVPGGVASIPRTKSSRHGEHNNNQMPVVATLFSSHTHSNIHPRHERTSLQKKEFFFFFF
ncbi:MAG: hypothetical protein BYD32DRAFT_431488, partial [Podila humilis]